MVNARPTAPSASRAANARLPASVADALAQQRLQLRGRQCAKPVNYSAERIVAAVLRFSVSKISDVCSGGSSSNFSKLLAASRMNADDVKMVNVRFDSPAAGNTPRESPAALPILICSAADREEQSAHPGESG